MAETPAWDRNLLSDPHTVHDKSRRVRRMFAAIAPFYDLNNRIHSFGRDQSWRRRAVKLASLKPTDVVVDVACGTGDLTLAMLQGLMAAGDGSTPAPGQVIGVDFTWEMLPRARQKAMSVEPRVPILLVNGDATTLPLPDACADVVSIAFGIRNVQEPARALREFRRILRPGGRLVVLEFSEPENRLLRSLNRLYTHKIMPVTATWISRDRTGAYRYLPRSIGTFWNRQVMTNMLREADFVNITMHPMTFGVCVCYRAVAP
ncbi:MAG: bifunctional demethylmenaquinone methyltransferase/2-methoxy-6-polyprenyl-1,4-benzoquinol methylase UbiE [Phycisphaerae bacterium]|nr:bifunctional demethylmenaquinone methyltransferase/2-methoxy-6-polyprenyl-1,4-benzoquinol methylase UbiE [Phycisphaerae bacterium]MDW8262853.1 bifunctional demethylmenaquinone methyltransferase/2-methoxy-6-polyprenyl-1,4-benzoquinol methylase UbiE [Phycisphaerales bacterium]